MYLYIPYAVTHQLPKMYIAMRIAPRGSAYTQYLEPVNESGIIISIQ